VDNWLRLASQIVNGLQVGGVYALIALGYTMVYGIVKLINFAHGDLIMVGSYLALVMFANSALPFWLVVVLTAAMCIVLSVLIERVAYKPLRNSPRISSLITTIGVSFFLQNGVQLIFSPTPKSFPIRIALPALHIGKLAISGLGVLTVAVVIIAMILLDLFVRKTKMGKAMRAVSEDISAAQLMGVNINTTISVTFAIGAGLAALGAILFSTAYPTVSPTMGALPGMKAFVAAVLGGIGVMPGAMLGAFILGLAESLTKAYISTQLADAVVFGILIIVLLIKPSGILGKTQSEKV
jgi:branched-chain amino acid transport system permease protein